MTSRMATQSPRCRRSSRTGRARWNCSRLLGMTSEEIEAKIEGQTQGKYGVPYQPARLLEDAPAEIVMRISEHRVDLPGVIIEEEPYRSYPHGMLAGAIIGYVGQISQDELKQLGDRGYRGRDRIGKTGLEREFEEYLRGQDGITQIEVDSLSRPRGTVGFTEPVGGATLVLTIDARVQRAAEEALRSQLASLAAGKYKNARAGAAVAIDPVPARSWHSHRSPDTTRAGSCRRSLRRTGVA